MTRGQLIVGAGAPTLVATLGAAYVALAYHRAADIQARRAEADAVMERLRELGRAGAEALAGVDPSTLPPLADACRDRLAPPGGPAAVMAYVMPPSPPPAGSSPEVPEAEAARPGEARPPEAEPRALLVGWSTWGLATVPWDGARRPDSFSALVLDALAAPTGWEALVWRRDGRDWPRVTELSWLAVVRRPAPPRADGADAREAADPAAAIRLAVAVYAREGAALVCLGQVEARPRPRAESTAVASRVVPPQHVSFALNDRQAITRAVRFAPLNVLCDAGGPQLCAHAAGRR